MFCGNMATKLGFTAVLAAAVTQISSERKNKKLVCPCRETGFITCNTTPKLHPEFWKKQK